MQLPKSVDRFDQRCSQWFSVMRSRLDFLYGLMWLASMLGYGSGIWLLCALYLDFGGFEQDLLWKLLLAEVASFLVVSILMKHSIARERPNPDWLDQAPVFRYFPSFSFPSGHASSSAVGTVVLSWASPNFTWLFVFIMLTIAFSRLYLQKHYVSDVVAGLLIGGVLGWIAGAIIFFV